MNKKTIVVTGASRGLGAATARIAAELGARVVLTARSEKDLRQVATDINDAGGEALLVPGDLARAEDCQRVVQETISNFGELNTIVNNASVLHPIASLADGDPGAWFHNVEVNLLGPYYLVHFALPHLRAQKGKVINVSSGAAVRAIVGWSAYCVSKAGLNHLTRLLATEEPDIVAVTFRPGKVDTEMQATIRREGKAGMPVEEHAQYIRFYEEGELLQPELPGRALAVLALYAPAEWSGDFVQWDEARMEALVNARAQEMN